MAAAVRTSFSVRDTYKVTASLHSSVMESISLVGMSKTKCSNSTFGFDMSTKPTDL